MHEDEDQGFMLLVLGVLAAVLMAVLWVVMSDDAAPTPVATAPVVEVEATPEPTAVPEPTAEEVAAPAPTAVPTEEPTATPEPSPTPEPTATPEPSPTPEPTAEPTPDPLLDELVGPIDVTVTAEDGTITLEGLVTEPVRRGLVADYSADFGEENVVDLLEVTNAVNLDDVGLVATIKGRVANEEEAEKVRFNAGFGADFTLDFTDNLLVGAAVEDAGDAAEQLNRLFAFNPVQFATGSATIESGSFVDLDDAAALLKANPDIGVLVEGHTDDRGGTDTNQVLSEARAASVVSYLTEQGVNPDQLEAEGFGETQPKASNDTEAGRAENRRIEFSAR